MKFSVLLQHCLPHHFLSTVVGKLASCRCRWFKNFLIFCFVKHYKVDMAEAILKDPYAYESFNDFFTRKLKRDFSSKEDGESDDIVVSPVDGCISQIGKIEGKTIIQAKGRNFNLDSLLGFDEKNKENVSFFDEGNFVTLYLSPKDYHRIHMPITGDLISTTYIPGRLYSVNPLVVNNISNIYAKNERLISVFQTKVGYMAVILVGAMLVGSIETVWGGASPERKKRVCAYNRSLNFKKGEEIARFKFGSTVILLFMKNKVAWAGSAKIGKKIFTKSKLANLECLD